jgi:hypothetical protein
VGGGEVNAIVRISSSDSEGGLAQSNGAAEIIILDVSGSMDQKIRVSNSSYEPRQKLSAAKEATAAAIDCIRDGVRFGIVAGAEYAELIYPDGDALIAASADTRADARRVVSELEAGGGTAIGSWLGCAKDLFAKDSADIKHAILLTDGRNENESHRVFEAALEECNGHFQCDCRGVGTDWEVRELRKIADTLLGSVEIIAKPDDLPRDFQSMMKFVMEKQVSNVCLRIWIPRGADVLAVKQVFPNVADLRPENLGELERQYLIGAWGHELRDYQIRISLPAQSVGQKMLAGRVKVIADGEMISQTLIEAEWTTDVVLSTRINNEVAHYTGRVEQKEAIQQGLAALEVGDKDTATVKLGQATRLADAAGDEETIQLLKGVVEIEDAPTGRVRLRRRIDAADEMTLDTRSTKTIRAKRPEA